VLSPDASGSALTPEEPLVSGAYTAQVYGVEDAAGQGMEEEHAWSFEVGEGIGSPEGG
jgi:hypothetical protein